MAMTQKQYLEKAGGNWNKPKMKSKKTVKNDHDADDMKMKKKSAKKAIKTSGTFEGKSNRLGGGGRFAQLAEQAGGGKKGAAIAAAVGIKKYGNRGMVRMATAGRKKK